MACACGKHLYFRLTLLAMAKRTRLFDKHCPDCGMPWNNPGACANCGNLLQAVFIRPQEAGEILGKNTRQLKYLRKTGRGPRWWRFPLRRIVYERQSVYVHKYEVPLRIRISSQAMGQLRSIAGEDKGAAELATEIIEGKLREFSRRIEKADARRSGRSLRPPKVRTDAA
jgi:hypothetical protein